jgi:hypothetical protein
MSVSEEKVRALIVGHLKKVPGYQHVVFSSTHLVDNSGDAINSYSALIVLLDDKEERISLTIGPRLSQLSLLTDAREATVNFKG